MRNTKANDSPLTQWLTLSDLDQFTDQMVYELGVNKEDLTMFTVDIPNAPQQYEIALVAPRANTQADTNLDSKRALGICLPVNYRSGDPTYRDQVDPERAFRNYFYNYEQIQIPKGYSPVVELLSAPSHGEIVESRNTDGNIYRSYVPKVGFTGEDKAVFQVAYEGKIVKIIYVLKVTELPVGANGVDDKVCPEGFRWKISTTPTNETDFANLLNDANDAFTGFWDLAGTTVGETTGLGLSAQITFDSNAAGNGWLVDLTSLINDEFLSTADANKLTRHP
jgi:hypothetical protein